MMDEAEFCSALRQYIVNEVLNEPDFGLTDDDPLVTSGLIGSFALVDIAMWIEGHYGVHFSDRDLMDKKFDTVRAFSDYVQREKK
jgi:acyl carrier protein